MSISLIITAFKEPKTIVKALGVAAVQLFDKDQIIVVAPDELTLRAARRFSSKVELVKDRAGGKPAALNLARQKARGEIIILTDGDVYIGSKAIKALFKKFKNSKNGIVSGRPIPINDKKTLLGFWAYLLTESAHRLRLKREKENRFFDCSGYLLAIRKKLLTKIPEDNLVEDAYLSQRVYSLGFKTAYAPEAEVRVKFPESFSDWLKQKVRSVGGAREQYFKNVPQMRGLRQEIVEIGLLISLCHNPKEYFYLLLLFLARIYLWILIFWKLEIKKEPFEKIWQRVESTK